MFGESLFSLSQHVRSGGAQVFSEFVATFGLLAVILGTRSGASGRDAICRGCLHHVGLLVHGLDIVPAVTVARAFTDTFAGIRPVDAPMFIAAQIAGAFAATRLFQWLTAALPAVSDRVVVPHRKRATMPSREKSDEDRDY
jgi:glycerol uptake facilitator-like aquaporin